MTIKMFLMAAASSVAMVLSGCGGTEGPRGAAGPTGPPGTPNRNAIYCRNAGDATLAGGYTLTATCDAAADFPLEGACSSGTLPGKYYIARNEPVGWNNQGAAPGTWVCTWRAGTNDVVVDTIAGTVAWICCVPP